MIIKVPLRKSIKLEKEFQADLWKWLRDMWCFVYKIPDASMWYKPYDMEFVFLDWETYHCELKIIKWKSINTNALRPNQHASLSLITKLNPRIALVIVYSTEVKDYTMMTYKDFMWSANENWTISLF